MSSEINRPTRQEVERAADTIRRAYTPEGLLPPELFGAVTSGKVSAIVELVPVRTTQTGTTEVLLFPRPNDPVPEWRDRLHNPGANVLLSDVPTDELNEPEDHGYSKALKRLQDRELGGTPIGEPVLVGPILKQVARGPEAAVIFWAELQGEPKAGELYNVSCLPENVIPTNARIIKRAARHYERRSNRQA